LAIIDEGKIGISTFTSLHNGRTKKISGTSFSLE